MTPPRALRLNAEDNVMVAVDEIRPGDQPAGGPVAAARVPKGHKIAISPIAADAPIVKFGQIIGFAAAPIAPGDWVHEHNVVMQEFSRDYHFCEGARPETILPVERQATFEGYRRANGKAGTRNYLAILTSVNCSATVARLIAREVERSGLLEDLSAYRRRHSARPRHRLRHGGQGRGIRDLQAHAMGLCRQSQYRRRVAWSVSAARCSRSAA